MKLVYHPGFFISLPSLLPNSPFELGRPTQTRDILYAALGSSLQGFVIEPQAPASDQELSLSHSAGYLQSLTLPAGVARAFEIPALRSYPLPLLTQHLLEPIRWGVAGTIVAVNTALAGEPLVFSLAGGYHHAQFGEGGGFCIYSDIAISIQGARQRGALKPTDRVLYIDVDAHLGNGVALLFTNDASITIVDAFNRNNYPMLLPSTKQALARVSVPIPLAAGTTDIPYVRSVSDALSQSVAPLLDQQCVALAIVNLGYDPLAVDKLGGLGLTLAGIGVRDRLILDELSLRAIPTVVLPSGGYSPLAASAYAATILDRMAGFGFPY